MKKALLILGGIAGTLVLALVIFLLTFDADAYKPRLESAASQATGMNVRINGKMKLTLFPHAGFRLEEVLIKNQGADVLAVKRTEAAIRLLPLLKREVSIKHIRFIAPRVFITKDEAGRFNFATPEKKSEGKKFQIRLWGVEEIVIKGGYLQYLDQKTGQKTEANACDFTLHNLSADAGGFFRRLSCEGDFACKEFRKETLKISAIRGIMKVHEGFLEANPITMKIFGGDGRGSIGVNFAGDIPGYTLDFTVTKVRFEELLEAFKQKKSVHGELALKWRLAMQGKNAAAMTRTAQGNLVLDGQDLLYQGIDIDRMLEKYEKSTNISLIDIGGVLLAGPLGLAVTKGYDYGSAYWESRGGQSAIKKLISRWTVKNGVAEALDVALSTGKNRVALKGRLDFVRERFDDVTVAVVDEKGCALLSQHIHGPFRHPVIEQINLLISIAGPIINLYQKTEKLLGVGDCQIFYAGALKHP